MALDDHKHTEVLRLLLTEREIFEFRRLARIEQRTPADLGRLILRQHMFGILERHSASAQQLDEDE
jgi:hypothetical protein